MGARSNRLAGQLGRFAQQYSRKAQRNTEPNDRQYSREVETAMKRLPPEILSELLSGESEDSVLPAVHKKPPVVDPFAKYRKRRL